MLIWLLSCLTDQLETFPCKTCFNAIKWASLKSCRRGIEGELTIIYYNLCVQLFSKIFSIKIDPKCEGTFFMLSYLEYIFYAVKKYIFV